MVQLSLIDIFCICLTLCSAERLHILSEAGREK